MVELVDLTEHFQSKLHKEGRVAFDYRKNSMKLELTNDEVNFIQQVLGELPSKTGAFLVMNNIAKQVQEHNSNQSENQDGIHQTL